MSDEQELVRRAREGDKTALEALIHASKDLVYNLAVRMLGDPAEAEDASQEILIRIVTGLATFRGDSAFRTWVYRVASNHLLTVRKQRAAHRLESFEALEEYLDKGIAADEPAIEDQVLVHEAKMTCSTTMLTCLDRDHRLAYILGEILELSSEEGAEVLELSPEAFRKRLSRARDRMTEFMSRRCGLVDDRLPCRCAKQAAAAVKGGRLKRSELRWADRPEHDPSSAPLRGIDAIQRAVAVFRGYPNFVGPASLVTELRRLLEARDNPLLT
jgi:RNA polymerase sigma factor (sigma-70 family)